LATKWSASADSLTWTFDLRQGVKFSDGTEFDSSAVKYSFDRSLSLYLDDSSQAGIGYKDIIDSVEATSKYQVVFHLKIPFAPFLSLMAFQGSFIVNPKLAPMDAAVNYVEGDAHASNPNDLGPYLLSSWSRKAGKDYEMKYDANPNYYGIADGYPKTKHIVIRFYSDATALALAMKSGDVDMAFRQLAATDIKNLQADSTVKVWEGTGAFIQYVCFQQKIAPFDNPKVRQAIAAALNRQELVDTVFLGQAVPLYSMIPNGMAFHQDSYKTLGDANITFTVSVLQELGYG
jgi:peptide/nickel transport system substrate-binding protein